MANDDDVELLQKLIMHGGTQAFSLIPAALKKVVTEKQWRKKTDKDGKPFMSFESFVVHPLWQGLETTIDDLRLYCRKQPEVLRLILAEVEPGATLADEPRDEKGRYRRSVTTTGRGATYALKRLKRDHPDLYQQVLDGKLSVNAAAIEAGFRKQRAPIEIILKLLPKLTPDECEQISALLDEMRRRAA